MEGEGIRDSLAPQALLHQSPLVALPRQARYIPDGAPRQVLVGQAEGIAPPLVPQRICKRLTLEVEPHSVHVEELLVPPPRQFIKDVGGVAPPEYPQPIEEFAPLLHAGAIAFLHPPPLCGQGRVVAP